MAAAAAGNNAGKKTWFGFGEDRGKKPFLKFKARYEAFGCAGQAGKIKAVSLEAIAAQYAKGELKAIVK